MIEREFRLTEIEVIGILERIKRADLTPPYGYSSTSTNRESVSPKPGQRWMTPYEIADSELKRIKIRLGMKE